jgi:hypothetical protein
MQALRALQLVGGLLGGDLPASLSVTPWSPARELAAGQPAAFLLAGARVLAAVRGGGEARGLVDVEALAAATTAVERAVDLYARHVAAAAAAGALAPAEAAQLAALGLGSDELPA